MSHEILEKELDLATDDFINSYNSFKKAATRLMEVMTLMRSNHRKECKNYRGDREAIQEFNIKITDGNGRDITKPIGIKYLIDEV